MHAQHAPRQLLPTSLDLVSPVVTIPLMDVDSRGDLVRLSPDHGRRRRVSYLSAADVTYQERTGDAIDSPDFDHAPVSTNSI